MVSARGIPPKTANTILGSTTIGEQLSKLQTRLFSLARDNRRARLLMSTPGVGVHVALMAVARLIDLRSLAHLRRASRVDLLNALAALIGVLLLGILQGILLAALISVLLLLALSSPPM
jgi:uncharacterized membrane protein